VGLDHQDRGFLALAVAYRHLSVDEDVSPVLRGLVSPRFLDRARILAGSLRVAYMLSAGMARVLPRTSLTCSKGRLVLSLGREDADLASDKVANRVRQLGRLIGREAEVFIAD
jgi:exopolyphosphatase/guanosine-5'-triphosphate,3'-diphosphate pyrophosphatase